jgi:hypothetical protein
MSAARGGSGGRLAHTLGSSACFSGIAAALVYSVRGNWVDVAVLLLVGLGQVLAFLAFRAWPARLEASAILLLAGVSSAEQLYDAVPWWDLMVHFLATYALVRIPWNLRLRAGASPSPEEAAAPPFPARLRWCLGVGLALAVAWELMELIGFLLVTPEIHIPPLDTATDVLAGLLGAALCAFRTRPT